MTWSWREWKIDYNPDNPSLPQITKEPYGGEEVRAPCLLLAGERERDLDLERERLRDDLDLLLDLERRIFMQNKNTGKNSKISSKGTRGRGAGAALALSIEVLDFKGHYGKSVVEMWRYLDSGVKLMMAAERDCPCLHTWTLSRTGTGSGSGSESGTGRTLKSESWSEMRTSLCSGTDSLMNRLQVR